MQKMNPGERSILISSAFGHVMCHVNMLVFPALALPLAGRYGMPLAEVLGLSFYMYLLFGLTALPWGMAADRLGGRLLMAVFYSGACLSCVAAGLWIDSPFFFPLSLSALGFFAGIYHPAALGMISKGISSMGMAMGYNGIFGSLGVAAAPLLAGALNWLWGPKAAYIGLGGINFLGLVLMLVFPIPVLEKGGGPKDEGEGNGNLKAFLVLLAAMTLGGVAYRGATVILPAYMELRAESVFEWLSGFFSGNFSENLAATALVSLVYLASMAGQYAGGRAAGRLNLKIWYLFFHAGVVPAAFLMAVASDIPLAALAMVYFFFLLGMQPIENTLVARLTPKKFHHSAYGVKFVMTFGVGALAVKMVERIEAAHGIQWVFPALGAVSVLLVGAIGVLFVFDRAPTARN
jgi:MFS family permease